LLRELKEKVSVPIEVLIVYDSEDDNTIPVVSEMVADSPFEIRLVKNRLGSGPLNAIKTGFKEARQGAVLVIMADLSDDLSVVDQMYRLVARQGFDIVCGSRYMPGGKQINSPILKGLLSRAAGMSLHYIAGIPTHDVTNSFKIYKRQLLETTNMESEAGFVLGMEIVIKSFLAGKRITEVPCTWRGRVAGKSRFRMWKWLPTYLRWYVYALKCGLRLRGSSRRPVDQP